MSTSTTSQGQEARSADESEDFRQTAEYRRRMALLQHIAERRQKILDRRGGVPIPAEEIDAAIEATRRGE